MKKAFLIIAGTLVAFAAGMALMYAAVPTFNPELAEQAQARADSLAALALADTTAALALASDTLALAPDSLRRADTLAARPDTLVAALRDSLAATQQALALIRAENQALVDDTTALRARLAEAAAARVEAATLSATLSKLEDKALAGVLAQLDLGVLEALFAEASGRNRTRLLQALPPDFAARFVHRLMDGPAPPPAPAVPDTALAPIAAPTASANG